MTVVIGVDPVDNMVILETYLTPFHFFDVLPSICAKVRFKSEKAEIRGLCDEIQNELNSSSPPREILVLFHSKEIGQKYAKALQAHGFQIEDLLGKPGTVSKAVLLLYEVLRLITDQSDNLAARFLLQEFFKMDSQWITKIRHISQSQDKSLWQTAIEADGTTEMIISWSEKF